MLDVLIRGATVIDGSGKPAFEADVAIHKGLIQDIGALAGAEAHREITARGMVLAPGFIDITNHSDVTAALFFHPAMENLLRQGITTIIGGNCGASLAPLTDPDIVHGIRTWAPTSSVNVNWLSVSELFHEIERRGLSLNFGMLAGHGTMRRGITKEEARALTPEERTEFKAMLARALDEGALGLSANLGSALEADASASELGEMLRVVSEKGGIFKLHLRNEGRDLLAALNEALRISVDSAVPTAISHFKAVGRKAWPTFRQGLAMIARARVGGQKLMFDVYPYRTTGSRLHDLLPAWVRTGGYHAMMDRLRDVEVRNAISADLKALDLHYDRIRIAEAEDEISPGKTIAELASRSGREPEQTLIELLLVNQGRVSIIGKTLSHRNVELAIKNEASVIATNGSAYGVPQGQSLPHPRSFGAFPHFLHRYARDRQVISWESAIAKITSLPAEFLGLSGRGVVRKRGRADLVLFDPALLNDHATYKNPYQSPAGISHVLVNGVVMLENGTIADKRPGQIVRRGQV